MPMISIERDACQFASAAARMVFVRRRTCASATMATGRRVVSRADRDASRFNGFPFIFDLSRLSQQRWSVNILYILSLAGNIAQVVS